MSLVGWLALGDVIDDAFVAATGYQRQSFAAFGSPPSGQIPQIHSHPLAGPVHAAVTHGAIFDAKDGGYAVATWPWLPPLLIIPANFPALEYVVTYTLPVTLALNASTLGRAMNVVFAKGLLLGGFNGQPLVAGVRLAVRDGVLLSFAQVALRKRA